jgi:hypothetical protein
MPSCDDAVAIGGGGGDVGVGNGLSDSNGIANGSAKARLTSTVHGSAPQNSPPLQGWPGIVDSRAAWDGSGMTEDNYTYYLDESEIVEIEKALSHFKGKEYLLFFLSTCLISPKNCTFLAAYFVTLSRLLILTPLFLSRPWIRRRRSQQRQLPPANPLERVILSDPGPACWPRLLRAPRARPVPIFP